MQKNDKDVILELHTSENQAPQILKLLYEEEFITEPCSHEFTETVGVDDDTTPGKMQRSNPDVMRCKVCGKYYNPKTEEWYDEK